MDPRPPGNAAPQYSPDGRWWWDGQRWVPAGPASLAAAGPPPDDSNTGLKVLLVVGGTVVGLALVAALAVAVVLLVQRAGSRSTLSAGSGSVVFDDNFSSDRGWDVTPISGFTTDLHLGNPGSMHLAVPAKDDGYHELYPGPSYARLKFTATMSNLTGTGDVGLLCQDANSNVRYRFWAGAGGSAFIDVYRGSGTDPTVLAQADARRWAAGETHTMTAICSSDGKRVSLQLLIDGRSVLQASDSTTPGPFRAGVLVLGPVDVDLRRFTVATL